MLIILLRTIRDRIKDNKTNISKKLFQVGSTLTISTIDAKQKWISNIVDHLLPVTIFKMPSFDLKGYPEVNSIFDPTNSLINNPNYVIFNPNRTDSSTVQDSQNNFKDIIDKTKDNLANDQWIKNNALELAKEIPVEYKNVLYTQIINDRNTLFKELDETYIQDPITIYKAKDILGKEKYFNSRDKAKDFLLNGQNYKIETNSYNLESLLYRFEDKLFSSYNDIYEYIIENSEIVKGGSDE